MLSRKLKTVCKLVTAEDMDRLDEALRCTIKKLWPIEGKKMHAMLIPPNDGTSPAASTVVNLHETAAKS